MSGTKHTANIATAIRNTNGSVPHITSDREISGAMFLITKRLSPTGGWMRPISITMVMTTPNQIRSKPAALIGGRMTGAVIKMIETGGRKKPSTTIKQQDRREQPPFRKPQRSQPHGGALRNVQIAHHISVEQREPDDEEQHGAFAHRAGKDRHQPGRTPDAIHDADHDEREDRADARSFRRRREPA